MKNRKMGLQALVCFMLILGFTLPASLAEASAAAVSLPDDHAIIHSALGNTSLASIIHVPDNYSTIQAAVDAANSGDTIIVSDGVYTENVYVDKDHLTLQSENGAELTVIEAANPNNEVVRTAADYVTIRGFTIKGATEWYTAGVLVGRKNLNGTYRAAEHCKIYNNVILNNSFGIRIYMASNNVVGNNTVSNNFFGIRIRYGSSIIIDSNVCLDNEEGIHLEHASNCTLTNNTMSGNKRNFSVSIFGHGLAEFTHNINSSNKVDGKPIYYWYNEQDKQVPADAGYVGMVNCTNITVTDAVLTNNGQGVLVAYSDHSTIQNVNASNNYKGIQVCHSSNIILADNIVSSNRWSGIVLEYSSNCILTGNAMSDNQYNLGIHNFGFSGGAYWWELADFVHNIDTTNAVDGKPVYYWVNEHNQQVPNDAGYVGIIDCSGIMVKDLALTGNEQGLLLAYASDCTVENVSSADCAEGILLYNSFNNSLTNNSISGSDGIRFICSSNNMLSSNTIWGADGISLLDCSNNILTQNTVSGYYRPLDISRTVIGSSGDNRLYLNNLMRTPGDEVQVYGFCALNSPEPMTYSYNSSIYTSYLGNYWNDYTGSDADGDGIGEAPYPIPGNADNYPLMEPFENYDIPLGLLDSFADLGNPDDEVTHNLVGWGDAQGPPENPFVSPSGDRTKRYMLLRGDSSVDLAVPQTSVPYLLIAEVEDGHCTDNFEIYVNGQGPLYSYTGTNAGTGNIDTIRHHVLVPQEYITRASVTVTFRNTATDDCGLAAVYNVGLQHELALTLRLDKNQYNPGEMIKIYAEATDADGNRYYPLTTDNTEVRIDGNSASIEDIISRYILLDWDLPGWWRYELSVKAPSEPGDHTVWVQVTTDQGAASASETFAVYDPFTFVHMTDVHIGPQHAAGFLTGAPNSAEKDARFSASIDEMNEGICMGLIAGREKPDFILITGDITERGYQPAPYKRFRQHLQSLDDSIGVFTVPGNHDWYGDWVTYFGLWSVKPELFPPPFWPFYSLETYRTYLMSPDFDFWHGGFSFIGLDSGHDVGPSFLSIGGSGLTSQQMQYLGSLPSSERKIVFMHHTVFDSPPWNHMITNNRDEFREYCRENNVQLVLSGHTHGSRVFDASGEAIDEGQLLSTTSRPLFVETPSTTHDPNGYRVIKVDSHGVTVYPYRPTQGVQYWRAASNSAVLLHAYDSQGRHTGLDVSTGGSELNIPRSFYLSVSTYETQNEAGQNVTEIAPETIYLYDVSQNYTFEVISSLSTEQASLAEPQSSEQASSAETQTFNFTAERQTSESRTTISYIDIPLGENTTATLPAGPTATNYTLDIDYDGDEIVDEMRVPDSVETDYAPTATIISPEDSSAFLQGEGIVFAGNGTDPEDGVLPDESLVWISDMDGAIGIGSQFSANNLSVGTHNVTLRVNDAARQINTTTVSILVESVEPDMFADILTSEETPSTEQHAALIETLADEPCNLTVHIENTGAGTLHNVQVLTNVGVTEDAGNIDQGEIRQVPVAFTPTLPGLDALNVTVVSDEIEESLARALLIQKFDFIVSMPKTEYGLGEQIALNFSVTNEVPDMRFTDGKIRINISNSAWNETFEIPLPSLPPFETETTSFAWDSAGAGSGIYTIASQLMVAGREVAQDENTILLGGTYLSLKAGWNMVSVPSILADNSTGAVFPGVAGIFTWDATGRSYYEPAVIEPERGYWVAVTENTTITINGTPIETWTTDIMAGWNMIGSVATNSSIADPDDDPDGSVIPPAYWWDPVTKSYIITTNIELGKGYWVASINDCTVTL